jgi:chromosome segregation ATPase
MLEELQRLQAHISALKSRLSQYESEKQTLEDEKSNSNQEFKIQIDLKNNIITQKQKECDQLAEKLESTQSKLKQINDDALALADRYNRLEKSCTDLKNRFQEILAERNELRVLKEKFHNDQRHTQNEIKALQNERERLLQKNDHAKAKVETIIQRLSILGTAQDSYTQEIQHLAHPSENNEEV